MAIIFVYTTIDTVKNAEKIADFLLQSKYAACVNWGQALTSMYWWEGKLEKSSEIPLIVKTLDHLESLVYEAIRENHPYATPCLVSFKAAGSDTRYLAWLEKVLT